MSLRVRFQRAARAEHDEALSWYEDRSAGLGKRLLAAFRKTIEEIGEQPDRHPEVEVGVREATVPGWPYCFYYQVRIDHVVIIAVHHSARDPAIWQWRRESE
jgi:toxin ParE1/3/4